MNLPGTTGDTDFRIGEQHSHGESNPEHFSVKTTQANTRPNQIMTAKSRQRPGQMLLKAPVCPLSVQSGKKTDAQNPQVNS
jgi:hypothetical protein